jgi:hypothetical protein
MLMKVSLVHPTSRNTPRGGRITAAMNLTVVTTRQVPEQKAAAAAVTTGAVGWGRGARGAGRSEGRGETGGQGGTGLTLAEGPVWIRVCLLQQLEAMNRVSMDELIAL